MIWIIALNMNRKIICALILILYILTFISCDLISSDEEITEIDSKIIGEWYYITYYGQGTGPTERISGIQIKQNGQVFRLAIETSSGQLSISDPNSIGKIKTANNGSISYSSYGSGFSVGGNHKSSYEVKGDSLLFNLSNDGQIPLNQFYIKSEIGEQITEPVESDFQINRGNEYIFVNAPISSAVSSYAYLFNIDSSFVIVAAGSNEFYHIRITRFEGVGEYDRNSVEISHESFSGDFILGIGSYSDSSVINLRINKYQESKRISGELNFTIEHTQFTDGMFSIPVY